MDPRQRIALVSVAAAAALVAAKLAAGLDTASLGLIAEAAHSSSDFVAALLTLGALRVAARPADRGHPFGHGKAEHLAALAEGLLLVVVSAFVAYAAVGRLSEGTADRVEPATYAIALMVVVLAVDAARAVISRRAARRYSSPALAANALHFGSDLAGTAAVLAGLIAARAGLPEADPIAALAVVVMILIAASRLVLENVQVLMDRSPLAAERAARAALAVLRPPIEVRRLRIREAGGNCFCDVVIRVAGDAALGQGHADADRVEAALEHALHGADVVVHVEPAAPAEQLRQRATAAALTVSGVREVHNVTVLEVDEALEVTLHLKLPPDERLDAAHAVADRVEAAITRELPRVSSVQTHLEPLAEAHEVVAPSEQEVSAEAASVRAAVLEATGAEPRELRFRRADHGLVCLLTLATDADRPLEAAHELARRVEGQIRAAHPTIAEVVVHVEPE